jgi:hypothetical protein
LIGHALEPRTHQRLAPAPSPLRMEHSGLRSASSPSLATRSTRTPSPVTPTVKPNVRFSVAPANDDDDPADSVPLGYVQRQQQTRASKAKFLQDEQARRAHADEARRMAAERAQWEQERVQWAQEREARKQRELAEQYAAARARQSHARDGRASASPDATPKPAPRRQWSEPAVATGGGSPVSMRPPSIASGRSTSGRAYPTPASSTEDVRARNRSTIAVSDPAADRGRRARRVSTHGAAAPQLPLDAPLLPPTAPFMHEFGGRRPSHSPARSSSAGTSSASGSGSARGALPHNRSSDSVPQQHARGASVSSRVSTAHRMSVAMPVAPVLYPAGGPQTPPAGYWMVPVPVMPMQGVPMPVGYPLPMMAAPATPTGKRQSVIY